jgi:shikimate O-hydroxycinnamoyltransferase
MPKPQSTLVMSKLVKCGATCDRQYLTGVDVFNTHTGIPVTLVYPKGLDVAKLEAGLVREVARQPVMAGRIKTDEQGMAYIDGNDGGLALRVHQVKGRMPNFGPDCHMAKDLKHFGRVIFPWSVVNKDVSLFHIDVHQYECGGVVLCITGIHSLYDGSSFWKFMLDWAKSTRGEPTEPPDFDRSIMIKIGQEHINDPFDTGLVYSAGFWQRLKLYWGFAWQALTALDKGVFRIPASTIDQWKAQAKAELPPDHPGVSTVDLVTLHVMKEMSPVMWCDKDRFIGMVIDLRYKRRLRLPRDYYGNALGQGEVRYTKRELETESLAQLAARCKVPSDTVTDKVFFGFLGFMERMRQEKKCHTLMMKNAVDTIEAGVVLNNCSHFPTYDIDFGTGKPSWHDNAQVVYRMIMLCPTPEQDGGIDVHLTARKNEVAVFKKLYS